MCTLSTNAGSRSAVAYRIVGSTAARLGIASKTAARPLRRFRALGPTTQFAILGAALAIILASVVGRAVESEITQIVLGQAAVRASDHVALAILNHVTEADFEPPHSQERLDELSIRLLPLLARARGEGSRVLRVNLYARDGTIMYSDMAGLQGRKLSPVLHPPLARALAGTVSAEATGLGTAENADLIPRYGDALEIYVPVKLRGEVIGAYELYVDPAAIRLASQLVWATVAGGFALMFLALLASARVVFRLSNGRLAAADPRRAADPRTSNHGVTHPGAGYALTRRELDVVRLMATDRSYTEIAAELVISEETVRTHARSILHKLRQPDRAQAVAAAVDAGLLRLGDYQPMQNGHA